MRGFENVKKDVVRDGIKFDSDLEARAYDLFVAAGLNPKYNEVSYVVQQKQKINFAFFDRIGKTNKKYANKQNTIMLPITYTPDFIIETDDTMYIIEIKGLVKEKFTIIKKMFAQLLNTIKTDKAVVYAVAYTLAHVKFLIERICSKHN
jgi:hypothetical protein